MKRGALYVEEWSWAECRQTLPQEGGAESGRHRVGVGALGDDACGVLKEVEGAVELE